MTNCQCSSYNFVKQDVYSNSTKAILSLVSPCHCANYNASQGVHCSLHKPHEKGKLHDCRISMYIYFEKYEVLTTELL